jgi:hypothetical protein
MIEFIALLIVITFVYLLYLFVAVCCGLIYLTVVGIAIAIGVARKRWRDAYDGTSRNSQERRRVRRADTR